MWGRKKNKMRDIYEFHVKGFDSEGRYLNLGKLYGYREYVIFRDKRKQIFHCVSYTEIMTNIEIPLIPERQGGEGEGFYVVDGELNHPFGAVTRVEVYFNENKYPLLLEKTFSHEKPINDNIEKLREFEKYMQNWTPEEMRRYICTMKNVAESMAKTIESRRLWKKNEEEKNLTNFQERLKGKYGL